MLIYGAPVFKVPDFSHAVPYHSIKYYFLIKIKSTVFYSFCYWALYNTSAIREAGDSVNITIHVNSLSTWIKMRHLRRFVSPSHAITVR